MMPTRPRLLLTFLLLAIFTSAAAQSYPTFPPEIPSCVTCQINYEKVCSCSRTQIFANFSAVMYNPLGFIAGLQCACGDSFLSVYPLCIQCFQRTNQMGVDQSCLRTAEPPAVENIRSSCAALSAVMGNASGYDATATPRWPSSGEVRWDVDGIRGMLGILIVALATMSVLITQWLP